MFFLSKGSVRACACVRENLRACSGLTAHTQSTHVVAHAVVAGGAEEAVRGQADYVEEEPRQRKGQHDVAVDPIP